MLERAEAQEKPLVYTRRASAPLDQLLGPIQPGDFARWDLEGAISVGVTREAQRDERGGFTGHLPTSRLPPNAQLAIVVLS
jgi:hypothetical protein